MKPPDIPGKIGWHGICITTLKQEFGRRGKVVTRSGRSAAMRCHDWPCQPEYHNTMFAAARSIVRILTATSPGRRDFDATGLLAVVMLSLCPAAVAGSNAWQSTEEIAAVAEDYLRGRLGPSAKNTSVEAGVLDPRHLLAQCSRPIEAFLRRGTRISARTIVGVRCEGSKPWKVYVPVNVIVTDTVFVAARTLPRGHLLTAADLVAEERDVTRLVSGYVSSTEQLVGQRLRSQLLAGRILTPKLLQADMAIRRGQSVTLVIRSDDISIQMGGKALVDGAIGQRIRVENSNSGRVVEGIVRSQEHVEVLLSAGNQFFHAKPKVSPKVADTRSSNNDR